MFKLIWLGLTGDDYITEVDWTSDLEPIRNAIERLMHGPGSFVVREIKVIDGSDRIAWWYKDGEIIHGS